MRNLGSFLAPMRLRRMTTAMTFSSSRGRGRDGGPLRDEIATGSTAEAEAPLAAHAGRCEGDLQLAFRPLHPLREGADLIEVAQQLVDVLHLRAAALGDAALAG